MLDRNKYWRVTFSLSNDKDKSHLNCVPALIIQYTRQWSICVILKIARRLVFIAGIQCLEILSGSLKKLWDKCQSDENI